MTYFKFRRYGAFLLSSLLLPLLLFSLLPTGQAFAQTHSRKLYSSPAESKGTRRANMPATTFPITASNRCILPILPVILTGPLPEDATVRITAYFLDPFPGPPGNEGLFISDSKGALADTLPPNSGPKTHSVVVPADGDVFKACIAGYRSPAARGSVTVNITPPSIKLTQTQAERMLNLAGIPWTSTGGCSDRYDRACTSFEQIRRNTIKQLIAFKQKSGCAFTVTGGTEVGHTPGTYSHWNGYKVDIGDRPPNPCVDNYITQHFTHIETRSDGAPQYADGSRNRIYAHESDHWDTLYI